jgi:uncharacterized membrane protein
MRFRLAAIEDPFAMPHRPVRAINTVANTEGPQLWLRPPRVVNAAEEFDDRVKGTPVSFNETVEVVGKVIDAAGVTAILLGSLIAAMRAVGRLRRDEPNNYRRFRQQLGRSILLGLELLVAADIIRTVAVTPTLTSVAVLAGIVLIRTFLSFSLELEITGRWPWQKQLPEATS